MYKSLWRGPFLILFLLTIPSMKAFAQVGEIGGQVFMRSANGQKVPLGDAQIDVFRVDMTTAKFTAKTDRTGVFLVVGLPFIGRYVVAASFPNAAPAWANCRVNNNVPIELVLTPGNGKRLTLDDIKSAGAGPANTSNSSPESSADRGARDGIARKNAELEASNKKITQANEIITRAFKAGNDALTAANVASKSRDSDLAVRRFTEAVAQYDEGLAADPEQVALLTNKAVALKGRGVERFNTAVMAPDGASKSAAMQAAKDDLKAAADAATKAVGLIKVQPIPTDAAELKIYNANKYAALVARAQSMRLFVPKGGEIHADEGAAAYREYIAAESDPAARAKAHQEMAQMLLDAGQADAALVEFRAILTTQPNSPEANLGAGMACYASAEKTKFQQAANYLQRFVDTAPDTNPMKADVKAILAELKNTENITPQRPQL